MVDRVRFRLVLGLVYLGLSLGLYAVLSDTQLLCVWVKMPIDGQKTTEQRLSETLFHVRALDHDIDWSTWLRCLWSQKCIGAL